MKDIIFTRGKYIWDFFILPTIRIEYKGGFGTYLTIDWLKWFFGIRWFGEDEE
jgi:hypothetical protein